MEAFVSWSGGKDCMYAMYKYMQKQSGEVLYLLNMCDVDSDKSRSHGIKNTLVVEQSKHLSIPLIQCPTSRSEYELNFKKMLSSLKQKGIEAGIFGDIYLNEHRQWIERVCNNMDITPVFPLWGYDTSLLVRQFVEEGFKSIIVAIKKDMLPIKHLGRVIDDKFLDDISNIPDIDLCAERGEYHSFVFDGPCFLSPVDFRKGKTTEDNKHWFLELNV